MRYYGIPEEIIFHVFDASNQLLSADLANLTVNVILDGAATAAAGGVLSEVGLGAYKYLPTSAESKHRKFSLVASSATAGAWAEQKTRRLIPLSEAYPRGIVLDADHGAAGTEIGINGTEHFPVNTREAAWALTAAINATGNVMRTWEFAGDDTWTLPNEDFNEFRLIGTRGRPQVNLANRLSGSCLIEDLVVTGQGGTGTVRANRVVFDGVSDIDSLQAYDCQFAANGIDLKEGTHLIHGGSSYVAGTATPPFFFDPGKPVSAMFRGYTGGAEIRTLDENHVVSYDCPAGQLIINSDCTGGVMRISGITEDEITDNSNGAVTIIMAKRLTLGTIIDTDGDGVVVRVWQLLRRLLARHVGKRIGGGSATLQFMAPDGVTPRVTMDNVDNDGNTSDITFDDGSL